MPCQDVPIRHREDLLLRRFYDRLPVKLSKVDYSDPHFKTFILLQAHFSRVALPSDLALDQEHIISKLLRLLAACVDVMASNGFMNALSAMVRPIRSARVRLRCLTSRTGHESNDGPSRLEHRLPAQANSPFQYRGHRSLSSSRRYNRFWSDGS